MTESRVTAARRRLKAWRDKRAEEKAAPHRDVQRRMLGALQPIRYENGRPVRTRQIYETGSANRNAVAKRRRRSKMARKSRRANRPG